MMTSQPFVRRLFPAVCLATLLSGCALMREDTPARAQITPEQVGLAGDIQLVRDHWPEAQWWKRYQDPQLEALIEQALKGSPTIGMAQARVAQAQSQADLLNAGSNLQISALGFMNRQRASANGFLGPYALNLPALGVTGPWYTEATVGLFADLNIDIWGMNRSAVEAAIGVQNARVAELMVAELDISAGIAQLYYAIQAQYQLIDLLTQTKSVMEFAVDAHQGKVRQGLEAKVPFHGARAQVLAVDRQIAAAQGQIKGTREALRALVGADAGSDLLNIRPVPLPRVQAGLPDDFPFQLLARRADLQAMRFYVQSSLSQIDVAKAAFYPSFDIKAFWGLDSIHLSKFFRNSSQQINLIPGLYLPVFDGGRLNANLHGARAASNMLIEQYNQAILDAVRDVAVSGSRLQALNQERVIQLEKIDAVRFAQSSAEAYHERGLGSLLLAHEARLPVIAEETALLLIDGQRIAQEIILTKALGGGYNAQAVKASSSSSADGTADETP